jgi:hypothetical protein
MYLFISHFADLRNGIGWMQGRYLFPDIIFSVSTNRYTSHAEESDSDRVTSVHGGLECQQNWQIYGLNTLKVELALITAHAGNAACCSMCILGIFVGSLCAHLEVILGKGESFSSDTVHSFHQLSESLAYKLLALWFLMNERCMCCSRVEHAGHKHFPQSIYECCCCIRSSNISPVLYFDSQPSLLSPSGRSIYCFLLCTWPYQHSWKRHCQCSYYPWMYFIWQRS